MIAAGTYLCGMLIRYFHRICSAGTLIAILALGSACHSQPGPRPVLKVDWLEPVKTTTRISSNTYSDFVVDPDGNSYLACFYTDSDRKDYLYIVRVDADGRVGWEVERIEGRACGIAMDQAQRLWVTGFVVNKSASRPFLLHLDPDTGEQLQWVTGRGSGTGYHCQVSRSGQILVQGNFGDQLEFGNLGIARQQGRGGGFVAAFDQQGRCQWLQEIDGIVNALESDDAGHYYLAGAFYETFGYDSLILTTTGPFDQDAFVLKIDQEGNPLWVKKFGNPGIVRKGYRTAEAVYDLNIAGSEEVLLTFRTEGFPKVNPKHLGYEPRSWIKVASLDLKGNIRQERTLLQSTRSDAVVTFRKTPQNYYLATIFPAGCTITNAGFELPASVLGVLQYDLEWKVTASLFSSLDPDDGDALLRVSRRHENHIYFSGHFRNAIGFGRYELSNQGNHELFLMKLK